MRAGQGVDPARRSGTFNHEAVAVDTATGALYMTEDRPDGGLYRFTPDRPADLALRPARGRGRRGRRPAGVRAGAGPGARCSRRRAGRCPACARFNGGEGIWYDGGTVYFSTKGDNRVWAYDTATGALGHDLRQGRGRPGRAAQRRRQPHRQPGGRGVRLRGRRRHADLRDRARRHGRAVPAAHRRGGRRAWPTAATSWRA